MTRRAALNAERRIAPVNVNIAEGHAFDAKLRQNDGPDPFAGWILRKIDNHRQFSTGYVDDTFPSPDQRIGTGCCGKERRQAEDTGRWNAAVTRDNGEAYGPVWEDRQDNGPTISDDALESSTSGDQ